jgi:hypothetical protein
MSVDAWLSLGFSSALSAELQLRSNGWSCIKPALNHVALIGIVPMGPPKEGFLPFLNKTPTYLFLCSNDFLVMTLNSFKSI